MHGGEAAARLLFGEANPSGKLTESWPFTASDASSAADYDRGPQALYYESIYVGYRFYDAARTPLRFPFGHGLSYTRFHYRDLQVQEMAGEVIVRARIENVGDRDGIEVVQLYVRNNRDGVFKADKELRAFDRVAVPAGASVPIELTFALEDLSHWDVSVQDWVLDNGEYEILLAASAADIRLAAPLTVTSGRTPRSPYPAEVDVAYATPPRAVPAEFPALLGREVPDPPRSGRLTMETRLTDARRTLLGSIMLRAASSRARKDYAQALALPDGTERDARVKNAHFVLRMMPFQSLRSMAMASGGALPLRIAEGISLLAQRHPIRGVRRMLERSTR
jgi:beta-glucosidase